jgi:hypothetical protein
MCRVGVVTLGASGEIANVGHVFQPDGRTEKPGGQVAAEEIS